jgi:hypothetical protein
MAEVEDGYDGYYADRLWQLLPQVYRALDSEDPSVTGPLQELLARVGVQTAVVRRSIDRLWADQSIETCDDWAIPYIGELLDTNLVNGLDPAAQRVDVAKTIHYRRRKGTLAVLEELARDVTRGVSEWDAHLVEAFRRLSRTRHLLDPPIGLGPLQAALPTPCPGDAATEPGEAQALLEQEGLLGRLTGTPAGGFANLRSLHGAVLANSPFDEYFHTVDMRRGSGAVGRYGIPKLLVFVWRLRSFPVVEGTPVQVTGCPSQYVFDPTGRHVPLFLPPMAPEQEDAADIWTASGELQVPGPLSSSLQATVTSAETLAGLRSANAGQPVEPVAIEVWPEVGQLEPTEQFEGSLSVSYQYGFPAAIGAGPYNPLFASPPPLLGAQSTVLGGGGNLGSTLEGLAVSDAPQTVTIADSRTYDTIAAVGSTAAPIRALLLRAGAEQRPVVRIGATEHPQEPPRTWVFTGGQPAATASEPDPPLARLTLDGLLVSGGDVILRGAFSSVRITGCTADPGTLDPSGQALASSVDERPLAPTRIWIEADPQANADAPGTIEELAIDHCVLGPIRTRNGGTVETVRISDSIVQGIAPAPPASKLSESEIYDPQLLARALASAEPLSQALRALLPQAAKEALASYQQEGGQLPAATLAQIVAGLSAIVEAPTGIYSTAAFLGIPLPPAVSALLEETAPNVAALNRALLEAGYPVMLAPAALALAQGTLELARTTVMGATFAHRLSASDSLFSGFTAIEDTQDGCFRFSAAPTGSRVPRQYRSAKTAAGAQLFTSDVYGEPAYGQLLEMVDQAIASGGPGVSISEGAENGAEMGAYASGLAPIKERGLQIKYAEYMPLGLTPVVIHVS